MERYGYDELFIGINLVWGCSVDGTFGFIIKGQIKRHKILFIPWTGVSFRHLTNPIVFSYHIGQGLIGYISSMYQHPICEV